MKLILQQAISLFAAIGIFGVMSASAQTSVDIVLEGTEFVPLSVTINVGDTVRWYNTQGETHNINGSFWQDNPEAFGIEVGTDWIYTHVFTIPGTYQYHCDVHVDQGMEGIINVEEGTSSIYQNNTDDQLIKRVYPIPADDFVVIELQDDALAQYPQLDMKLYDYLGRVQHSTSLGMKDRYEISVRDLSSGLYFFQIADDQSVLHTGKVVVR